MLPFFFGLGDGGRVNRVFRTQSKWVAPIHKSSEPARNRGALHKTGTSRIKQIARAIQGNSRTRTPNPRVIEKLTRENKDFPRTRLMSAHNPRISARKITKTAQNRKTTRAIPVNPRTKPQYAIILSNSIGRRWAIEARSDIWRFV